MTDSGFIDIVLFAMVAVFLVLRLRSVLGRRTGTERRREIFERSASAENVVTLPERGKPVEANGGAAPARSRPASPRSAAAIPPSIPKSSCAARAAPSR